MMQKSRLLNPSVLLSQLLTVTTKKMCLKERGLSLTSHNFWSNFELSFFSQKKMFKLLYIVVVIATLRLCASQLPQTGSFADASVTWGGKQFTGCTGQYAYEGQVKMLSPVCSKVCAYSTVSYALANRYGVPSARVLGPNSLRQSRAFKSSSKKFVSLY